MWLYNFGKVNLDYNYEDIPLHKAYEFDPIPKGLPQKYEKNIIGIGVQMWGEFIPTVERMNEQLYPRIAALAEVAWSNRKSDYDHFLFRLIGVKERWRSLGIQIKD